MTYRSATELVEALYPQALGAGLSADEFWDMSIGEVEQIVNARLKRQQEQTKLQATMLWNLGNLIAFAAHDPKHYPPLHEAFPGLFRPPQERQTDWRVMKARMTVYSVAKNAKMRGVKAVDR